MEGQAQFFYQSAAGTQRARAHIGSHHTGRNPLLHQIGAHIAVVAANIRHRAAGRTMSATACNRGVKTIISGSEH